jgi:hypothetical protein
MADIEYLMVAPDIIASPESIRNFTDSLAGYKLKDETIPARGILTIENYLLTLYGKQGQEAQKKELVAPSHDPQQLPQAGAPPEHGGSGLLFL